MLRRVMGTLAAAVLALTAFAPIASAQNEPPSGFVAPCYDGATWNATPGEPLDLLCGWTTQGGPGKIVSFLNGYTATVIIRDEDGNVVLSLDPDQLRALWGDPVTFPADDDVVACAGPTGRYVLWEYWFNAGLPAGTYTVTMTQTYTHPVTDGWQTCWFREDGSRLAPPPSLYRGTAVSVSTLVVE